MNIKDKNRILIETVPRQEADRTFRIGNREETKENCRKDGEGGRESERPRVTSR